MDKRDQLDSIVNQPGMKMDSSFSHYKNKNSKRHKNIIKRMDKIVENVSGPKVLDCGCGTGLICFLVSQIKSVDEIHGVDLQKSVLVQAQENMINDKTIFHNGFVEELDFDSEYFDTVIMGEVIEHVYSVEKTIEKVSMVLKKNGILIITCPYKGKLSKLHVRSISKTFLKEVLSPYFNIKKMEIIEYGNQPNTLFCLATKRSQ